MATTDHRAALARAYDHAADVVASVRPDQLGLPTPCPDFDVAALVDHLVGAGRRAVEIASGETPPTEEFPHVELAEAPARLRSAGSDARSAWREDARLGQETTMPWGETYTERTLVDMYCAELVAHTWDLAAATGQRERLDQALANEALEAARAMLKPEYRDQMGPGSPFGAEVAVAPDAAPVDRFAGFMGRDPRWTEAANA